MFILASSFCKSLQCLISFLTQGGEGGHLFRLICSVVLWGGRSTVNKYHWRVWGVGAVYGPHWVCPGSQRCELSGSTLLRVQVALQGNCPKRALYFVHFPGSGSQVLHKGTDSVGYAFCALPRSEQLRRPGAWLAHCPRWTVNLNHLPSPGCSVSEVCCGSTISGVLCVPSGELISDYNPPGRCQPSRIPGRHD